MHENKEKNGQWLRHAEEGRITVSEIDKQVPKFLGKRSETIYYVNHTFF